MKEVKMLRNLIKSFLTTILILPLWVIPIYGVRDTSRVSPPLNIGALESREDEKKQDKMDIEIDIGENGRTGDIVKFGEDFEIELEERIEGDVVAIGGSITVRGSVDGDVVAIGGNIEVDSTGEITGDAVSVGGSVQRREGGKIAGDEVSIGGFTIPFNFDKPELGLPSFLKRTTSLIGKVIRMTILIIIALLLAVFLPKPIVKVENTIHNRFFTTLGLGILGEILICPLLIALTVSIIGIPFVPLAILALIAALIFGYSGVSLLLGRIFIERINLKNISPLTTVVFGVILIELISLLGRLIGLGGGLFSGMGIFVGILGFLVTYIAWTLGLGAVILSRFGTREPIAPSGVSTIEGSK